MLKHFKAIYNTSLFYGCVWLFPMSPGTLAWKLFKNKKGKLSFIGRDLICDTKALSELPKNDTSLDEFTTAFSPFIPLLTLNGVNWKLRRKILFDGLRKISSAQNFTFNLPIKKGDVYWDFFKILFEIGFEMIFGRPINQFEFDEMYLGVTDINSLIKRHTGTPNTSARWKLYYAVVRLIAEDNGKFIFSESDEFKSLSEMDQVSIVVEDLLTSICIQCTDLICHLLLLYPAFKEDFQSNLDNCINETLRLYPLTDIWTRKSTKQDRAWIASLVQLNRSGWEDPDSFKPERWDFNDHPPLTSWGFDARGCPATKIGYNLSKNIFQKVILEEDLWIQPASNFKHDRTFPLGCQLWIGKGKKPDSLKWQFKGKWKNHLLHWFFSRLRVIDQRELW